MPRARSNKVAYYAVAVGRKTGVYTTWDDAKRQVDAFGGAKHKVRSRRSTACARAATRAKSAVTDDACFYASLQKFASLDEAQAYLRAHEGDVGRAGGATVEGDGNGDAKASSSRARASTVAGDAKSGTRATFSTTVSLASGTSASRAGGASTAAGGGGGEDDGAVADDEDAGDPSVDEYVLEFDGASRGNPGVAGAGALLRRKRDDRIVEELLEYLGPERTVNEAEYAALCLGLRKAVELGIRKIEVRGDSKLIVNQVDGSFKLKSANLKSMHAEACALKGEFDEFTISHVKREFNKHADHLANMAVDFGINPSRMTGESPFESGGGGGLGGDGGLKRRRMDGGDHRFAASATTRLGRRGYHAVSRASSASREDATMASVPFVVASSVARCGSSSRRSWAPLTRVAMGFARLRL